MGKLNRLRLAALVTFGVMLGWESPCSAQSGDELRQAAQNPIANLISLPFQNNTNFGVGKLDNTQNITNIQPVIPVQLNQEWNLITRWIMPVIYQPPLFEGDRTDLGLGDLNPSFFFSPVPVAPGVALVWGVGPALQLPTATDSRLGTGKWSAGPSLVALLLSKESCNRLFGQQSMVLRWPECQCNDASAVFQL